MSVCLIYLPEHYHSNEIQYKTNRVNGSWCRMYCFLEKNVVSRVTKRDQHIEYQYHSEQMSYKQNKN